MTDPISEFFADMADQNWRHSALCSQVDPDLFFPETGGNAWAAINRAKKICAVCPVAINCLEYAMGHEEMYGVWAGTTEKERRRLRRAA